MTFVDFISLKHPQTLTLRAPSREEKQNGERILRGSSKEENLEDG